MPRLTLPNLQKFIALLHAVERVERLNHRPGETAPIKTGEHTFSLAMLCWYIAECEKLDLKHEKIIKYALAHDIIEAYAGDTPAFDIEAQKDKVEREHSVLLRIKDEFPEFPELITYIEQYEARADKESVFVYAVDKLIDPLGTSLETGTTHWKTKGVTLSELRDYSETKISQHPLILAYWQELITLLSQNQEFYFGEELFS